MTNLERMENMEESFFESFVRRAGGVVRIGAGVVVGTVGTVGGIVGDVVLSPLRLIPGVEVGEAITPRIVRAAANQIGRGIQEVIGVAQPN